MRYKFFIQTTVFDKRGIAVIFAIFLIGVLLSIVLAISAVFTPKIRLAGETRNSATAFYAADSAIEWCLYVRRKTAVPQPAMTNGATFLNGLPVTPVAFAAADCSAQIIRAIGTYQNVSRAIEVSF